MHNVENVISQLETQRSAIDRAISALREVASNRPLATMPRSNGQRRKRHLSRRGVMSAAGRKRVALAMKKRWAAAKKAGKKHLA